MTIIDIFIRLGCATLVGLLLGLDREMRGVPAGLRTHALVGLSAAAITLSALLLHESLAAIEPDAAALRAVIDFDALPVGKHEVDPAHGAEHSRWSGVCRSWNWISHVQLHS